MVRKTTLLAMLVGVFAALAVPAAASAAPVMTMPAGTLVPVGTTFTATSFNTTKDTPLGKTTCEEVMFNLELTKNDAFNGIEAKGLTGNTTKNCKLNNSPVTIEEPKIITLSSTKSGAGTMSISFITNAGIKCFWSGTLAVTYTAGSSEISVEGPVSGACGKATFKGTYSLATTPKSGGGAVLVD